MRLTVSLYSCGSGRVKTQREGSSALSSGAVTECCALFWKLCVAALTVRQRPQSPITALLGHNSQLCVPSLPETRLSDGSNSIERHLTVALPSV